MRHGIALIITTMLFLWTASVATAATTQNKEVTVKKTMVTEDFTKSTKSVKKSKGKKVAKKTKIPKREVAAIKSKVKKSKKSKTVAKTSKNKKYWSVECRQGFIKDSYVYCARKNSPVAKAVKKPVIKKSLAKNSVTKRASASIKK